MNLSVHDKQLLASIDEQVKLLRAKSAVEHTIINTLMDFIPDLLCILQDCDDDELKGFLANYPDCVDFCEILANANIAN